jgi:hypothetical protein
VSPRIIRAVLNHIPVVNGQVVKLERDDEREVTRKHGGLELEAPSFELAVTCKDAAGNTATTVAVPQFGRGHDGRHDD